MKLVPFTKIKFFDELKKRSLEKSNKFYNKNEEILK